MAPGHTLQTTDTITPIGPSGPVPTGCGARRERRRPRRLLLNGPRPHPPSPRHDHPNRSLGARPHRIWHARRERRRPRRLLMNGRRPHPSSPRHDHPNRPSGPVPTGCGARAPGTPTSSSATLEWPQATPLKPPTRSPQSALRGPSPPDVAHAPVMNKRIYRLVSPHVTRIRRPKPGPEKSIPSAKPPFL
jgi:hypothetical protein